MTYSEILCELLFTFSLLSVAGEGLAFSLPGATLTLAPRSGIAISRSGLLLTPTLTGGILLSPEGGPVSGAVLGSAVWRGRSASLIISDTLLQFVRWLQRIESASRYDRQIF